MTQAFGDDRLELQLREVLEERAEEIASRAHTSAEMTAIITPRLRPASSAARPLEALVRLAAIALIVLVLLAAAFVLGARPSRPPVHLSLAVELPLAGEPGAPPVIEAVRLALRAQPGGAAVTLELPVDGVFDDSVGGLPDPDAGAANMRRIVGDPRFVAVIGPYNSFVAGTQIPISNAAGLLQCSPSNTGPGLTQGPSASGMRPRPDRPSYVRVAATDDAAAEGAATFIDAVLGKRSVFVVTTQPPWAGGRSGTFVSKLEALGGTTVTRGFIGDGGDAPGILVGAIRNSRADAVFFDGPASQGAALLSALEGAAPGIPFVSLDSVLDGPRSATGSFLSIAQPRFGGVYAVFPTGRDPTLGPQVETAYAAAFGHAPASYVLAGHACATVILDAIGRLDRTRLSDAAAWREAIRAEVTAPGRTYATAIGTAAFDAEGDVQPQRLSIYQADAAAGEWRFLQVLELPPGG